MSFASNKTAHTVPRVSRGRIVVNGGFKNGGFSMYGSDSRQHQNPNAWYVEVVEELEENRSAKIKTERKYSNMQADLDLRRAIRRKSGKLNDTEGMMVTQAKIDRYYQQKQAKEDSDRAESKFWGSVLAWYIAIVLLFTGLWLVGVVMILIKLTRRF